MYIRSYALFLKEMLMFRLHSSQELHSSQDVLTKDDWDKLYYYLVYLLVMNTFGTLFHEEIFPWHFRYVFQIPRHFQVFQTSGLVSLKRTSFYSLVWMSICLFAEVNCRNFLPQISQLYGRSPVWMLRWVVKPYDFMNFLPQTSQPKGRSPLCVRKWMFRADKYENVLSQNLHL